ncbi:valine--pyruvate transaminase [Desulfopila inferna]|uniref:valine--pyruvate transaminase n=1 Tax=Desulfopila inferna TaxID=468528 RepID=UPI00196620B5|nr:valine--pyruvate transaminase [Desulfopila inferna]MBM9605846.1 valine--pyruvate transaminase [Desulfopila inferna]
MDYSKFGNKFNQDAGILSLMKDMGEATANGADDLIMMGGGNPGHIPAFQEKMQRRLQDIAADDELCRKLLGMYCAPQGEGDFLTSLAALLRREYGWRIGAENICLTNGSQSGFFLLLNMFAGEFDGGRKKKIRLPLAPEYIGYADIGLSSDFFVATRPKIDRLEEHLFKYRVDFSEITIGEETGAVCVSRPTNPTGNVVTDQEIDGLDQLARDAGVPLIIDSAYGVPFPGIVFSQATPRWNENIILCLSLSKLGLPAVRTGIIIASEEVIQVISGMNAVISLAPTGFGAFLTQQLVDTSEILELSNTVIRPFYQEKALAAVRKFDQELAGTPYKIHKPEGAIFLWLWFENLPISSKELYQRLKKRGVLIISGHYFFPGLENDDWSHKNECIRVNYSQDDALVRRGIEIIGEEVKKAYMAG